VAAVKGKGAKVWLYNGTILTVLSNIISVKPPSATRDTIDTTVHGSTGDYREFISSLIDAGEVTFNMNYILNGADDTLILAAFAAGDVRTFAVDLNTATVPWRIAGSAIVTGYMRDDVVIDGKMTSQITLKVTGPITQAVAP